ncbi:MAG: Smr/MutS family protein [Sulfuricella sp.]|nr:Smr/MutS family protein [Sulfuricella sp.]
MKPRKGGGKAAPPPLSEEESALFRAAIGDARPLPDSGKAILPPPAPRYASQPDLPGRRQSMDDLSDHIPSELTEGGEELSYLRPGMARLTLRKLRRGHWPIQAELDLHGMTSVEARASLIGFLDECKALGLRCVRVIHGKGLSSKNREPVLKLKAASWLMQRDEILAFCQAQPIDGGGGAAIVLLKTGS